jgi:hypothetical protein
MTPPLLKNNLQSVLKFGQSAILAGMTPVQVETELLRNRRTNFKIVDQAMGDFHTFYTEKIYNRGYSIWLEGMIADPLGGGLSRLLMIGMLVPLTFFAVFSFSSQAGDGILEWIITAVLFYPILTVLVVVVFGLPTVALLGFPVYLMTRLYWRMRANSARTRAGLH